MIGRLGVGRGTRNALLAVTMVLIVAGIVSYLLPRFREKAPIRVGILHSLSGTMAISETSVVDATVLAIEEINDRGGLLGRRIEPIVVDGRSDSATFAKEARALIVDEKVSVIFGCWTSACRKTVKPIVEQFRHLLFYPVQYEGLESSRHIVYTGAAPNQQIIPAVKWSFETIGTKFFLVGSDYVFPRVANQIIRDQVRALRGEILGEEYILLGSDDVEPIVRKIVETRPDAILNTINGDSNIAFFRQLRAAGITPDRIPTVSFSITENELQGMDLLSMRGDYASWNYFQSLEGEANAAFLDRFRRRYGAGRTTSDPMEAAYFGVHLWAQAVADAETDEVGTVREMIRRQSWGAPEGVVYIDPENLHTWKTVRIGRIDEKGQFDIVWTSGRPVRPVPFPIFRSTDEWLEFLEGLRREWGGWVNPGVPSPGERP
ncbi:MAG TPA: urea ABC transporter substrate-binding protein [Thermoanaerobaculia bacterium]|nr:urea ABC transporter substrate-binding protein [Thermoanaerobaculia bacterium]